MKLPQIAACLGTALALSCGQSWAGEPVAPRWRSANWSARALQLPSGTEPVAVEAAPAGPQAPKGPQAPAAPTTPPVLGEFSQAPEAGTTAPESSAPPMIGDSATYQVQGASGNVFTNVNRVLFKIAGQESPIPQNRVFGSYHYFNNVYRNVNPDSAPRQDVHVEMIGVERSFMDGAASGYLRVPFFQRTQTGDQVAINDIADLVFGFKYALLNDLENGRLVSGGVTVLAPTGTRMIIADGNSVNNWAFQPWVGFMGAGDRSYVQGFSSVVIPTVDTDVTVLFNSIGAGYWVRRTDDADSLLTGLIPVLELHLTTPLDHRATIDDNRVSNLVNLTSGAHFVMGSSILTLGLSVPLSYPHPFDFEAIAQFNFRF